MRTEVWADARRAGAARPWRGDGEDRGRDEVEGLGGRVELGRSLPNAAVKLRASGGAPKARRKSSSASTVCSAAPRVGETAAEGEG